MKKLLCAAFAVCSLAGCAAEQAITTGKPLDPVQVQMDLQNAKAALQIAGCTAAVLSTAAAPVLQVTADAKSQKLVQAVDAGGTVLCAAPAPTTVASPAGTTLGSP